MLQPEAHTSVYKASRADGSIDSECRARTRAHWRDGVGEGVEEGSHSTPKHKGVNGMGKQGACQRVRTN